MANRHDLVLGIVFVALAGGLGLACAPPAQPVVHEVSIGGLTFRYQVLSSERVGRKEFTYLLSGTLANTGLVDLSGVRLVASSSTVATSVVDPLIEFGYVPANSTVDTLDTFSIRQDRRYAFDPSALSWDLVRDFSLSAPSDLERIAPAYNNATVLARPTPDSNVEAPTVQIATDSNPDHLTLEEYYDGAPGINLIGQTESGFTTTTVAGRSAFRFAPDVTLASDVIIVIPLSDRFVRITDSGEAFQTDGSFAAILGSLEF